MFGGTVVGCAGAGADFSFRSSKIDYMDDTFSHVESITYDLPVLYCKGDTSFQQKYNHRKRPKRSGNRKRRNRHEKRQNSNRTQKAKKSPKTKRTKPTERTKRTNDRPRQMKRDRPLPRRVTNPKCGTSLRTQS